MLIVALVLAVVSLAALVTAVVTSNEVIAWACIGFSALGVLLLIVDAVRDRTNRPAAPADLASDRTEVIAPVDSTEVIAPVEGTDIEAGIGDLDDDELPEVELTETEPAEHDYPDDVSEAQGDVVAELADYPDFDELEAVEDHPEEVVYDEPDYDSLSDDEPDYPVAAEEAAIHSVTEDEAVSGSESDHSTTVLYAGQPYTGELPTATESYLVINADTDTAADESATVIYADGESDGTEEHRESDDER